MTCSLGVAAGQQTTLAQRVADSAMRRWPSNCFSATETSLSQSVGKGMLLEGIDALWFNTADRKYYDFIKRSTDQLINPDGSLRSPLTSPAFSGDLFGKQDLLLYRVTLERNYYRAAQFLRQQAPAAGEFTAQDLYTSAPFRAEFAVVSQESRALSEIPRQFEATHPSSDSDLALYLSALVETLPYFPVDAPGRPVLIDLLNQAARDAARRQDPATGLWLTRRTTEAAPSRDFDSLLFASALAKGVRLGYLPMSYAAYARRAWRTIQGHPLPFVDHLKGAGISADNVSCTPTLASSANEDALRYEGAFLLAATEMELLATAAQGRGKRVVVDAWFNSARRETPAGVKESFHYKWDDLSDSGFSFFGHIFRSYGALTSTLPVPPTIEALKGADIYIIVSPDTPKKNPHPNFVRSEDAKQIAQWVKDGGVLLLMANDGPNTDIPGLDLLADQFGIHFNNVLSHHVIGDEFPMGSLPARSDGALFTHSHVLYMKDTCTISLKSPAVPVLRNTEGVFIAKSKFGKGTVLAVADPWLYNEYADGRKLPPEYDNFAAGRELARWLLRQVPASRVSSALPAH